MTLRISLAQRAAVAALLLAPTLAAAQGPDTLEAGEPGEAPFFGWSAGIKGSIGGNYLTSPDDVPPGLGDAPLADGAGGFGGGGGIAGEFRALWGHLGLEVDLLFDRSKNWASITYGEVVETDWIFRATSLRIPILIEGHLDGPLVRASLGLGPELVVGLNADTDVEVTSGSQYVSASDLADIRSRFTARTTTDTYLAVALGFAIKVWVLNITIDLRYAYNLTQPDAYLDRAEIAADSTGWTIDTLASATMDGRLMLGVSYDGAFDF
jgi:hypothetical protein